MDAVTTGLPPGRKPMALVMQGGGALGAYEWGAVTRLCEEGFHPVAVVGVSIGAVNAAAIAGARGGDICASLERLWGRLMMPTPWFVPEFMAETLSAFGHPAMFSLKTDYHTFPWWTAYCDVSPLRRTLLDICDFDQINDPGHMRFAVTATEIATGQLHHFCNTRPERRITPDHVLASGALPPGFPMAVVDGKAYWDGGVFDNTPVRPLFELLHADELDDVPIVLINLFPDDAAEPIPRNMLELKNRLMELTYENKFWEQYGGVHELHAHARMLDALRTALPNGSPLHEDKHFQDLVKRRCLKNLHVIPSKHVPMVGGMDFSERSVRARYKLGREAVERHMRANTLLVHS
jgi:NTE family protein